MHKSKSTRNGAKLRTFGRYLLIALVAIASAIGIAFLVRSRSRAQSKASAPIADQVLYRQCL